MLSALWFYCREVPHAVFSVVFPDVCRICHQELTRITRVPVCEVCCGSLQPISADYFCRSCKTPFLNEFPLDETGQCSLCRLGARGFDTAYCFGAYESSLRDIIHLYKYRRMKPLGRRLSKLLLSALPLEQQFDLVVPVPLHWKRKWERGFNQSEILAREVARQRGFRMARVLLRTRSTKTQASLSHGKRRENVTGAFRVKGLVRGLRILLVDDVMTTGSTGSACGTALKRAGAASVTLLTLARVDRRLAAPSARITYSGVALDGSLD